MSIYVETEVEVTIDDVVAEIVRDPSILRDVLRELAQRRGRDGKLLPGAVQYAAALQALESDPVTGQSGWAGIELWAKAFASFDRIDRDRALYELGRVSGCRVSE